MNKKIISFGEWKTWVARRLIDLDRGIHILKEAKVFVKDDMKEELWRALASKASQKLLLESLMRRVNNNDTVDIIARDMLLVLFTPFYCLVILWQDKHEYWEDFIEWLKKRGNGRIDI